MRTTQLQQLRSTAIDARVLEGRPVELLERTEAFRLVVEYFIGKV